MPELEEQMYCSQQIVIPPKFPYVLKRFAKAAIKTQPYDLLRWSCEYFRALAESREPPVKLRLEYPIYSSAGGLTAGYLRVLRHQLYGSEKVEKSTLETVWLGACLDPAELERIICLSGAAKRDILSVGTLIFFAVAAGHLAKNLTQTMILACETLTAEPEGGSASIPVEEFILMYKYLAALEASCDINYIDGVREDEIETVEEENLPEEIEEEEQEVIHAENSTCDFGGTFARHIQLTGEMFGVVVGISNHLTRAVSPDPVARLPDKTFSRERIASIDRREFIRRAVRPEKDPEVDKLLREQLSTPQIKSELDIHDEDGAKEKVEEKEEEIRIVIEDEDGNPIEPFFYGEPDEVTDSEEIEGEETSGKPTVLPKKGGESKNVEDEQLDLDELEMLLEQHRQNRIERIQDIELTLEELAEIVRRWKHVNYDLGTIAGRQMSTTSGEFIAESLKEDIMAYIDEQIAILPDPDLKKKKAKPEEVEMIRQMVEDYLDENMETIVPEQEEEAEEEEIPPEIVCVYAVPGIGPRVPERLIEAVVKYAREAAEPHGNMFMPRHIRHFLCPPLQDYEEQLKDPKVAIAAMASRIIS